MEKASSPYGYCHVTLAAQSGATLLHSNSERAFIISQLQDLLSPRFILGDVPAYRQLASCIDLLAFSITPNAVHFILFAIDRTLAKDFAHRIVARLGQYQYEFTRNTMHSQLDARIDIKRLTGPHEALRRTLDLHLLHQDWEHDRYSSIGFYLHDRRGDWMRIWRLSTLYEADPSIYRSLLDFSPIQLVAHPAS
ncbi:hypothetical protein BGO17_00020 [Candidatus Saccharibacteria bacterium 49-20]|nr:MAG: hypothetical protein BGO17_00020 [Candidatus Saccharibacteria bacterium 49-20]